MNDNIKKYNRGRWLVIAVLILYILFGVASRPFLATAFLVRIILSILTYLKYAAARCALIVILCTNSVASLIAVVHLNAPAVNVLFIIYAISSIVILLKNKSVKFYFSCK